MNGMTTALALIAQFSGVGRHLGLGFGRAERQACLLALYAMQYVVLFP